MNLEETLKRIIKFRQDRQWQGFHTPENLSKSISIEAAELLENFQWGHEPDMENMKEEIADILIYCLLFADAIGADPIKVINDKLDINDKRFPIEQKN
jgi:NTP pyrophosphatase (non-canonical NTP hydrolase)